jgi:putative transposase
MPRQARLDAPGALHHVMIRGIEGTAIFRGGEDREDFLARVERIVEAGALSVYAWALLDLDNHVHLLVRTGRQSLSLSMRKAAHGVCD